MSLHDQLRILRKEREMTLVQVADATHLSVSYISELERGKANPPVDVLARLAACYGLSIVELLPDLKEWETSLQEHPILVPELSSLVRRGLIDEQTARDLNKIQIKGKRPKTEEDWLQLYLFLSQLLKFQLQQAVIDEVIKAGERVSNNTMRQWTANRKRKIK